ncbi:MAG: response regulator [Pseudomonas proteolytica]|uniref:response regulator n=1 Tax=Pseudomonas proteolytica TaxID=219574 RepID=UPI003F3C8FCA
MGSVVRSTTGEGRAPEPPPAPHLNVLVVDDHSAYRALLGYFLQKLGVAHESVADGCQGLLAVLNRPFDLIISDCQMPNMDGYRMARAIRQHERRKGLKRVPIIALTANLQNDNPQRCCDAGMDAWLLKPLALEQLHAALLRWLPGTSPAWGGACAGTWPTRVHLVQTFGNEQVVDQMLASLLDEAWEDFAILDQACCTLSASLTAQRLHRLVGSLAFLGGMDLEFRGIKLIEQVNADGVLAHAPALQVFRADLRRCLEYLRGV